MSITIKTPEDIEILRESGRHLARVMDTARRAVAPGMSTEEFNRMFEKLIRAGGDTPALLNYTPQGAGRPFPASVCVSVNTEVVHGIPNENPRILEEGDLISFDCCLNHKGLITDMALTVGVGNVDAGAQRLMRATEEGLRAGIASARAGNRLGDIGAAIDKVARKYGYGNVRDFGGHGVGYAVHEEPHVMNMGKPSTGVELVPGMVLALEPMFTEGKGQVEVMPDGYTVVTKDDSRSAHFEHTILITENDPEILTVL